MDPSKVVTFASWLLLITRPQIIDAIDCYSCTNATAICKCSNNVVCPGADDVCYSEHTVGSNGKLYNLGCRNKHACPTGSLSSIVGRYTNPSCSQCCDVSNCNRKLCQDADPSCADTKDFSCDAIGSTVNYCQDPHHAKSYCNRFCGLCSMRDGGWESWSAWSLCDVTCGNGSHTRTRECTNPAPQDCGDNCVGLGREVQACSDGLCPVHGGWTSWNTWGGCSETCDAGIQHRHRSCSNPAPSRDGDKCAGDMTEDRVCLMPGCHNGTWSSWQDWSSCSRSCGYGLMFRTRSCSNPRPSLTGSDCDGDSTQTYMCNLRKCHDGTWTSWQAWSSCSRSCGEGLTTRSRTCSNPKPSLTGSYCSGDPLEVNSCNSGKCQSGGWSSWHAWSSCSRSCGDGIQSRSRICTNPAPSQAGDYCLGDPLEVNSCNLRHCQVKIAAFTVTNPVGPTGIRFTHIVTNLGNGYSASTGHFVCQYPGIYLFTVSLTRHKYPGDVKDAYTACAIYVNHSPTVGLRIDPDSDDADTGSYTASATLTVHLARGDYVGVGGGYPLTYNRVDSNSHYTGLLILPD